jgi:membrane-bound lytic murein transglycosylase A
LQAFVAGCARTQSRTSWEVPCAQARKISKDDEQAARNFFETRFAAYRIIAPDGRDEGLITGYYEPILKGRREAEAGFRHPVYAVPDDLIVVDLNELHPELRNLRLRGRLQGRRLVPYNSRAEIDRPGAAIPARPLAWVADAVELFFLQVQGSGQIELASGQHLRLGFADQNGHPYRSLGRFLIERGDLKQNQASMQAIKAWATANPDKLQEALNSNPSYVFFRELPAPKGPLDGPPGALGVPLTPGYSAAVDPRYIPLGAPVFLQTTYPLSDRPLERLVMAQDTGGAIRGAVRADFFWGTGDEAGAEAGRMRQQGRLWLIWPRGEPLPRPQ